LLLAVAIVGCGGGGAGGQDPTSAPVGAATEVDATTIPLGQGSGPAASGERDAAAEVAAAPTGQALSPVEVVDRVRPAVVTVVNGQQVAGLESDRALEAGRGTGFIVDDAGHVVTNEHVVRGGDAFAVILADGETRPATLVGADPLSDLAVVRLEGEVPATVALGDSDELRVAQPVLAIGSPLGEFTNTVTDGIVSALNRDLPGVSGTQGEPGYNNLIQHNAAINPGNSGGPLFDLYGRVIGVNTLGVPTEQGVPAQGLFFAIPANTVDRIAAELIERGRVAYPALGAAVRPITAELASQYRLPVDHGVVVLRVAPNGPAARAGIRPGDFITAVGGQRIDETTTYDEVLFAHEPGETVEVTVRRGDQELRVELTLRERAAR
jgi:2-alkenal reductase